MEEWKEVYGFSVLYEVSNLGRIRTKYQRNLGYTSEYRYIQPLDNGNGYLRLNLKTDKKQRTVYIHRLVAEAFIPNPNGYTEVNHKDENKRNNSADNLEWCSHQYNSSFGTKNERMAEKLGRHVRCIETGQIYSSLKTAAKEMGVGRSAISNCLNGRAHSSCGFTWEYVDVDA